MDRQLRFSIYAILPLLLSLVVADCTVPPLLPPLTASTGTRASGERPTATNVITFSPSGSSGREVEGYCWVRSIAVARDGAWRCISGNRIYDPCFSTTNQGAPVVCVPNPSDPSGSIRFVLTRPLPSSAPSAARPHAWALQLDDGATCTYFTGATGPIDGQRLSYGCNNGWDVVGEPSGNGVWTVREVQLKPRSLIVVKWRVATVQTAWE